MSNRHLSRTIAMQTLFLWDFNGKNSADVDKITKDVECKSLKEIITLCGGKIDFLKCDCEGGEWCIKSDEIKDIRRIEMECHLNPDKNIDLKGTKDMLEILNKANFKSLVL